MSLADALAGVGQRGQRISMVDARVTGALPAPGHAHPKSRVGIVERQLRRLKTGVHAACFMPEGGVRAPLSQPIG